MALVTHFEGEEQRRDFLDGVEAVQLLESARLHPWELKRRAKVVGCELVVPRMTEYRLLHYTTTTLKTAEGPDYWRKNCMHACWLGLLSVSSEI